MGRFLLERTFVNILAELSEQLCEARFLRDLSAYQFGGQSVAPWAMGILCHSVKHELEFQQISRQLGGPIGRLFYFVLFCSFAKDDISLNQNG